MISVPYELEYLGFGILITGIPLPESLNANENQAVLIRGTVIIVSYLFCYRYLIYLPITVVMLRQSMRISSKHHPFYSTIPNYTSISFNTYLIFTLIKILYQ